MGILQVGHRYATLGPRSLGRRFLEVWAKAPVVWQRTETNGARRRKPAAAVPGGPGRREALDAAS